RHKIPNVFSLSMMDVLCCALGCVILLWLLGAKQSEDETTDLRDKAAIARAESDKLLEEARDVSSKLDKRVRGMVIDYNKAIQLEKSLASRIKDLERARDLLDVELRGEQGKGRDLEARLKASSTRVTDLEADLKARLAALETERDKSKTLDKK